MEAAAQTRARTQPAPTFEDGLGRRQHVASATKEPVEVLVLKREHVAVPGFEAAVRERLEQVGRFHHESFVRVRGLARLAKTDSGMALVSDRVDGDRLSFLLDPAQRRSLEMNGALMLVGQIMDGLVAFHEAVPGCHGALGPERLILTPAGRLVIVDHVFGSALPKLSLTATELWEQMRIAVPQGVAPVFDQHTDLLQAGSVALALMLGRPLGDGYPNRIGDKSGATALPVSAALELVPDDIATWISRAIQRRGYEPFASSSAARDALIPILATLDRVAARNAVLAFQSGAVVNVPPVVLRPLNPPPVAPAPIATVPQPKPEPIAPAVVPVASPAVEPPPMVHEAPSIETIDDQPPAAFGAVSVPMNPVRRFFMPMTRQTIGMAAGLLMLLTTGGAFAAKRFFSSPPAATTGTVAVTTTPEGANITIDGRQRGRAPMTLALAAGDHVLQVERDGASRTVPLRIVAGTAIAQVVDLPPTVAAATGQLQIRTEPSGARVLVDGQRRGTSPTTVEGLRPGVHMVTVEGQRGSVTQDVTVESGATAAILVPLNAPAPPADAVPQTGWLAVTGPFAVQVFEKGQLLGSSDTQRITVPIGRHQLDMENEALGYHATRTVNVTSGKGTAIRIDPPKGSLSLNAVPWAEVWIDGDRAGETPIGNMQLPIGQHEVVFRHPELGEQRFTPTVTLTAPARVSADLRRKP